MGKSIYIFIVILQTNLSLCQEKLTYKDCVNLTLKNNLALKSASISEKIAVYKLRTNVGQLLPVINGYSEKNILGEGKSIQQQMGLLIKI